MLNEQQQLAFDEALDPANRIVFINGENGTGKTFTVARIISELISEGRSVVVTAPSHKAKSIISQELERFNPEIIKNCTICTTQSALGFIIKWFKEKPKLVQANSVNFIDVLIIDECSMMQESFWKVAQQVARKIILLGDELQLLAIEDTVDISQIECKKIYLTEQMRLNKKETILYTNITKFRKLVKGEFDSFTNDEDSSFEFVKSRNEIIEKFLDEKSDSKVVIAFTNEVVDAYNLEIKRRLGAKEYIEEGDILIAQNRWTRNQLDFSSQDDVVKKDSVNNGSIVEVLKVNSITSHYIICDVHCDGVDYQNVNIVRNVPKFKVLLDEYVEKIKSGEAGYSWNTFYTLKDTSLEAKHTYAITAHKSQGSTYDYVFYDHADALRFPKLYSPRISLVALSRAREKAYVFNGNGG